jgi:predicted ATPase
MDRFFVVTGGPGSGKSTLIDAFRNRGTRTMPEAGRAVIGDQVAIGGDALPWADQTAFADQMLGWEMRSWRAAAEGEGIVLFDRGVPDILGFLALGGIAAPAHLLRAARLFRYNPSVFIAPPWRDIYVQDAERRQSWEEADATCDIMARTYSGLGYDLVWLPKVSIEERTRFVTDHVFSR